MNNKITCTAKALILYPSNQNTLPSFCPLDFYHNRLVLPVFLTLCKYNHVVFFLAASFNIIFLRFILSLCIVIIHFNCCIVFHFMNVQQFILLFMDMWIFQMWAVMSSNLWTFWYICVCVLCVCECVLWLYI